MTLFKRQTNSVALRRPSTKKCVWCNTVHVCMASSFLSQFPCRPEEERVVLYSDLIKYYPLFLRITSYIIQHKANAQGRGFKKSLGLFGEVISSADKSLVELNLTEAVRGRADNVCTCLSVSGCETNLQCGPSGYVQPLTLAVSVLNNCSAYLVPSQLHVCASHASTDTTRILVTLFCGGRLLQVTA